MKNAAPLLVTGDPSLPLVTVGIPVYNEQKHITEAIESLLRLDYPNYEIVISDNCSTDGTRAICESFASADRRIRFYGNDQNRGSPWNFQRVLDLAGGEYFMWAGAHDRWHPELVSRCVKELRGSSEVVTVYPAAEFIDDSGERLGAVQTTFDTASMPRAIRPAFSLVALSGRYMHPIYGLHKVSSLRTLNWAITCYAPDLVQLFHLAFLGETVFLGGYVGMQLRQCADYGNWEAYYRKLYTTTDDVTTRRVVRDLRSCLMRVVNQCVRRPQGRLFYYMVIQIFLHYQKRAIGGTLKSWR